MLPPDLLGVGSISVASGLAVARQKDEKHDEANERYETDQEPPTAPIGVVKSSDADGDTGDKNCQSVEPSKRSVATFTGETGEAIDEAENQCEDQVEEDEELVLLATGSATEDRVLLQGFDVPVHRLLLCASCA
jgi:hypothetical protein